MPDGTKYAGDFPCTVVSAPFVDYSKAKNL
jgi:hypothetical protein